MVGSEKKYGGKLIICFVNCGSLPKTLTNKQTQHTKCGGCLFHDFFIKVSSLNLCIIISLDAHCKCQRFGGFDGSSGFN
jgi:hypothetical protein